MKIACLGPQFTFSDEALRLHYREATPILLEGIGPERLPQEFAGRDDVDAVLVPVFNNSNRSSGRSASPFAEIYTAIVEIGLFVTGAFKLPIHWCAASHSAPCDATVLYTMRQGPMQCGKWIAKHLGSCPDEQKESTAEAMRAASVNRHAIALGSEGAANHYGVPVQARNIENNSGNATWFFLLQKQPCVIEGGGSHTLVVAPLAGPPLADLPTRVDLRARWGIGMWEFLEIRGDLKDNEIQDAIEVLSRYRGAPARIIGCYRDEPEEWK